MQPSQPAPKNPIPRIVCRILTFAFLLATGARAFAQGALLLEQPYGVFGTLNPTGHAAIYLARVCADTPMHLRMCAPGETGVVLSRYNGMNGYDWIAIPLVPYLYAVEEPSQVPAQVDQETVDRLRDHYREAYLSSFTGNLPAGSFFHGGWAELVGTAYDRRTYAFQFSTTPEQDRELVERLNARPNRSHFNILYDNCADFDRMILNHYFPKGFRRTIFPDAGITTPKHVAYKLVKYSQRHPETGLSILEIPQVPGYRRHSGNVHGVAETLITNGYVLPVVVLNPYIAGGLLADYMVRGRCNPIPKNPPLLDPSHLDSLAQTQVPGLTGSVWQNENPSDSSHVTIQVPGEEPSAAAHVAPPQPSSNQN